MGVEVCGVVNVLLRCQAHGWLSANLILVVGVPPRELTCRLRLWERWRSTGFGGRGVARGHCPAEEGIIWITPTRVAMFEIIRMVRVGLGDLVGMMVKATGAWGSSSRKVNPPVGKVACAGVVTCFGKRQSHCTRDIHGPRNGCFRVAKVSG